MLSSMVSTQVCDNVWTPPPLVFSSSWLQHGARRTKKLYERR
ncbi:hypothetical protein FOPG_19265 [Fusarium oxysporum f. sp. conglutinans race 2 54008]|uniref:Uncharacterized protein n=1 Tax=Fusarium oxysporum f. sp. conglutinans race 2 54008 TaxID=1089457 RepID=X0GMF8_FUSOX|nr:hypothetical protein FOPG_19265 [Fusarium oxysporum f. sp. conglutinans race 2 54008]